MKLGQLVNDLFVKNLNELNSKGLPAAFSYGVSKIVTRAAAEQKEYLRLRGEVIAKYVLKNEDGTNRIIEGPAGEKFLDFGDQKETVGAELDALADLEIEVPKIKIDDLIRAHEKVNLPLSGAQINDLKPILDLEESSLG